MFFMLKFLRLAHPGIKTMGWHLKEAAFWAGEKRNVSFDIFDGYYCVKANGLLGMWRIEYSVLQTAQINRTRWKVLMQHEQSYLRVFLKVYWALPENTGTISVFIWSLWKTIEGFLFFFSFHFVHLSYLWVPVCVEWLIHFKIKQKLLSNTPVWCRFTFLQCGANAFQNDHVLARQK